MKKVLLLIFASLLAVASQAQRFDWVNFTPSVSGYNSSGGEAICKDGNGNLYTAATFDGRIVAGSDTINVFYFGSGDIYLTKWSPEGQVIWVKVMGGTWYDFAYELKYDQQNNQIKFSCVVQGDSTKMSDTTYHNVTSNQIVTFDTDGNFISVLFYNGSNAGEMNIDHNHLYYLDGWTTIDKADMDGNVLWSKTATGGLFMNYLTNDGNGNVLVSGIFFGSFIIGNDTVTELYSGPGSGTFLIKLDSSGNVLWGKFIGNLTHTYYQPIPVATDNANNIYVGDEYALSGQSYGTDTLTNYGNNSGCVLKFDSNGNALGAITWGATQGAYLNQVKISGNDVFAAGSYQGSVTVGTQAVNVPTNELGYLIKFDEEGNLQFMAPCGTTNGYSNVADFVWENGDQYFLSGTSNGNNNGIFGCYTTSYYTQFLTKVTDTVFTAPTVQLSWDGVTLSTQYTGTNDSFSWLLNGNAINGATGSTYIPTVNGTYVVNAESYGCTATDTLDITNVGVSEVSEGVISVYPNPAQNRILVSVPATFHADVLAVTDMNGTEMFSMPAEDKNEFSLSVADMPSGFYLLKLKARSKIMYCPFVVSR